MSILALVDPTTLLGQSVRDGLGSSVASLEVRLLAGNAEAEGTLTQIGSEVALVHSLTRESLSDVDLAILCGDAGEQQRALELIPTETTTIALAHGEDHPQGRVAVAGITEPARLDGPVVVSPHPAVVALSHLLAPLRHLKPVRVAATLLLPTSLYNEPGLDELFGQTRSILSFQGELPSEIFPRQLAFNLLPLRQARSLGGQVASLLDSEADISIQLLQAPVFHSLAVSALIETEETADTARVREALDRSSYIEISDSADTLGPIDAAAREEILVGRIVPTKDESGTFWIWAVMDNLTRGGASNAVELAEQLLDKSD